MINLKYFFLLNVGPHKDIFLTTFYGLYFSSMLHMLQISIWASEGSFHIFLSATSKACIINTKARRSTMGIVTSLSTLND